MSGMEWQTTKNMLHINQGSQIMNNQKQFDFSFLPFITEHCTIFIL